MADILKDPLMVFYLQVTIMLLFIIGIAHPYIFGSGKKSTKTKTV